ncbi:hypothetical protein ABGB12_27985, partial [Actinocorallia sp. B10E7]|uniref:hypothetical protein n=1 Tax=Actinocorallia sp. B10E7 TaxID=3153558 RepID=UPI00325F4D96
MCRGTPRIRTEIQPGEANRRIGDDLFQNAQVRLDEPAHGRFLEKVGRIDDLAAPAAARFLGDLHLQVEAGRQHLDGHRSDLDPVEVQASRSRLFRACDMEQDLGEGIPAQITPGSQLLHQTLERQILMIESPQRITTHPP